MSDAGIRTEAEHLVVRRFAAAVRYARLGAPNDPAVQRSFDALTASLAALPRDHPPVTIAYADQALVVGRARLPGDAANGHLIDGLRQLGIERIAFERTTPAASLLTLVFTLAHPQPDSAARLASLPGTRLERARETTAPAGDVPAIRNLYAQARDVARHLWDTAQVEGRPDPHAAARIVDELAQAVAQNQTALVALTAVKTSDYIFTHMVNVSILTMAQAAALGVEGSTLREFGVAAFLHDIGKVRTPAEILEKPDRLTDAEFSIMRMHVVDGAAILRATPEMPSLASAVAFEHHLRQDGSGYPIGMTRMALNLGTMLCSIADVHDAMRAQRAYQESFPTDRILAVLRRNKGLEFDQHLVWRFTRLMGIYPPGSLVRLDTGEMGVVVRVHPPDPSSPTVRVIAGADGRRLSETYDLHLWDKGPDGEPPRRIVTPVDPAALGVDPLTYL